MHLTMLKRYAVSLLGARSEFECPTAETFVVNACAAGRHVLRFGSDHDNAASELSRKFCHVTTSDFGMGRLGARSTFFLSELPENVAWFDQVVLMDLLEHLPNPQGFMDKLRRKMARRGSEVIITASNAGSLVTRIAKAFAKHGHAQFRGLAAGRRRSFTFKSLSVLVERAGYEILEASGVPMPLLSTVGDNLRGRGLVKLNGLLVKVSKHLFSYQICMRVRPVSDARPALQQTMSNTTNLRPQLLRRVA